jgi:CubicO group peptidase (beta-lactamase class C family)
MPARRTLGDVDAMFAPLVDDEVVPGIAYGVVDRTGLLHAGGHGVTEGDGPRPGPATAFRIASMTKSFTAASIMLLVERGALSLADPVSRYVPEFGAVRLPTSDSPQVTVGMLLTMSGGLPSDDPWADRQEAMSREAFGRLLSGGVRFVTVPGTSYAYSNLGYAVLGCVVGAVGDLPYHEFVARHLLGPLGMTSTGFDTSVAAPGGVATGHVRLDGRWQALPFSGPGVFSAMGGLFSTVEDLARWVSWLADAFPPRDDGDSGPLSRASRRAMQQVQRAVPPSGGDGGPVTVGYGHGLMIHHDADLGALVSHSGGYPGFGSHMRWHPGTGLGVVTLTNARYATGSAKAMAALRAVVTDAGGAGEREPLWPETVRARVTVERLLREWDTAAAGSLFADNVDLDLDLAIRRERIRSGTDTVGPLLEPAPDEMIRSDSPAHVMWNVRGTRGTLRCEIALTPQNPPRVQTLNVTVEEPTPTCDGQGSISTLG